jgi:hypothetical protein
VDLSFGRLIKEETIAIIVDWAAPLGTKLSQTIQLAIALKLLQK